MWQDTAERAAFLSAKPQHDMPWFTRKSAEWPRAPNACALGKKDLVLHGKLFSSRSRAKTQGKLVISAHCNVSRYRPRKPCLWRRV